MTDNQPAELLGCYGNKEVNTPHIDAFAEDAYVFENAYCVNGMCSPCRASVMTGLMPSQHGIHTWIDDRLRSQWPENWNALDQFSTLPAILAANGYETALIGKYHMGAPALAQNGFQHWVTSPHGHVTDFWNGTYINNGEMEHFAGHSVDYFTEKTIAYLQGCDSSKPQFTFVPYNAPYGHWPALKGRAKNRFRADYDDVPMHSVPREGLHADAIARFLRKANDSVGGIDHSAELRIPNDLETLRNYYSEMSMVDDGVGRILSALKALGQLENTIIIYTTDHGFSLGHHGIWGHSQATLPANAHRATFSIPLMIRYGEHYKKTRSQTHLSQIDLFPTILDMANISNVAGNDNSPANSFLKELVTAEQDLEAAVFMEQEETRAIRTPKWLYKRRFQLAPIPCYPDELYDLINDPQERINLVADESYVKVSEELIKRIDGFFRQYSAKQYNLWEGGEPQSNSDKPWLWQMAWGENWSAGFQKSPKT